MKCKSCSGTNVVHDSADRERIRGFLRVYPWVRQLDMAKLLGLSQARISEIVRCDVKKGGD